MSELDVTIKLDVSGAKRELSEVDKQTTKAKADLKELKQNARDTAMLTITVLRTSYGILRGVLRAAGITIDAVTNAIVQSTLTFAQQLATVATAASVTPGMQAIAVIAAIQYGLVLGSAIVAKREGEKTSQDIETINMIFGSMNGMIGGFNH